MALEGAAETAVFAFCGAPGVAPGVAGFEGGEVCERDELAGEECAFAVAVARQRSKLFAGDDGVVLFAERGLEVRDRACEPACRTADDGFDRFRGVTDALCGDADRVQLAVGRRARPLANALAQRRPCVLEDRR